MLEKIAQQSNRNLRRAILMAEAAKVQHYPFKPDQKIPEPDWQTFLKSTAQQIVSEQSTKKLYEVRQSLYELLIHGIPPDMIFQKLFQELAKNCDIEMKTKVAAIAAQYEHQMQQGSKHIFHLEAFVAKFMAIYKKFMEDAVGGVF